MKVTVEYENINQNVVLEYNTKYSLGDVVLLKANRCSEKAVPKRSRFYTDEKDSNGYNLTEEHVLPYTIEDVKMSIATGKVLYELRYSWKRCIFPSGGCGVDDSEILHKLTKEELDELLPKID